MTALTPLDDKALPPGVRGRFVEGVNDFTRIGNAAERDALARDFARVMARWHAIPAGKFAEIGLAVPVNAEQLVGNDLSVWERGPA